MQLKFSNLCPTCINGEVVNFHQLQTFVLIAEAGGFNHAEGRLRVGQPAAETYAATAGAQGNALKKGARPSGQTKGELSRLLSVARDDRPGVGVNFSLLKF